MKYTVTLKIQIPVTADDERQATLWVLNDSRNGLFPPLENIEVLSVEEIKPEPTPFDVERAKRGDKVITRDGNDVRILCFDALGEYPVIALVKVHAGYETATSYTAEGKFWTTEREASNDLMMTN